MHIRFKEKKVAREREMKEGEETRGVKERARESFPFREM